MKVQLRYLVENFEAGKVSDNGNDASPLADAVTAGSRDSQHDADPVRH
jgi:hypothetical protein